MKHPIDPKVDCVFKALLGRDENRDLLIHFLNAVLGGELPRPIVWVQLADKDNDREYLADKLSVVDVKAKDEAGRTYQIEVQMRSYEHLPQRIAYTWCDIYAAQLQSGQDYFRLRPTYSIWLLAENLLRDDPRHVHNYKLRDVEGRALVDNGGIYLFELAKFRAGPVGDEAERWLRFFKEGGELDDAALPGWMDTPEMRKAMSILTQFSEKEENYHRYQARMNFLREQRTIQWEYEQGLAEALERERAALMEKERERAEKERERAEKEAALAEKEAALAEKERERVEKEAALAEIERLKALLVGKP